MQKRENPAGHALGKQKKRGGLPGIGRTGSTSISNKTKIKIAGICPRMMQANKRKKIAYRRMRRKRRAVFGKKKKCLKK